MATIGVIRWPAFYMSAGVIENETNTIGPAEWQQYLPWYGVRTGASSVTCQGTQATMDAEIEQAWRNGVDYFAYDYWSNALFSAGNNAIGLHQASPNAALVPWCLCVVGANNASGWSTTADQIVTLMQDVNYKKIGTHPLIYIFGTDAFIADAITAGTTAAAQITTLRDKATTAGLADPYIAICNPGDGGSDAGASALGANFLSQYNITTGGTGSALTQAQKLTALQSLWATQVAYATYNVIPCVGLTWDLRARVASQEWCTSPPSGYSCSATDYYGTATAANVAAHVQAAIDFIAANPVYCATQHLLICGWDEYTEDGGLGPHLGDGGMYLQALSKQLRRQRENPRTMRSRGLALVTR